MRSRLVGALCSTAVVAAVLVVPAAVAQAGTAGTLPSSATAVRALRVLGGGVDLSWDPPLDYGDGGLTGYVVHRWSGGVETSHPLPFGASSGLYGSWSEPDAPADATYAVSAVNPIGEGDPGTAVAPTQVRESLIAATADRDGGPWRMTEWAMPDPTASVSRPAGSGQADASVGLGLSPDGKALLSTRPGQVGSQLWSEPVDRSAAPVLLWSTTALLAHPAWSPDGTRIAVGTDASVPSTFVLPATGGTPTLEIPGSTNPSWMPDSKTVVVSRVVASGPPLPLAFVDATTGAQTGTLAGTEGATRPEVSPDGRWLAFNRLDTLSTAYPSGTFVVPANGGTVHAVPNNPLAFDMAWSPQGDVLGMVLDGMRGLPDSVYTTTIAPDGTPSARSSYLTDRAYLGFHRVVWAGARVAIGPSPAVTGPSSVLPLDAAALPTGTTLTCTVDTGAPAPCAGSFRPGTLASGQHTLIVRSLEPSGRETIASRTFRHDSTAPIVRLISPVVGVALTPTLRASYAATDTSGVASYDVRFRRAPRTGVFVGFVSAAVATKSTATSLPLAAGYETCWSVRARDVAGNTSGWSAERCTSRPVDDRSMTRASAGWIRQNNSAFYLGTNTYTTRTGARLTLPSVAARQVYLVATRCRTCGSVTAYIGSTRIGAVSLASSTTRRQSLVALPITSLRSGTLVIIAASAKGKLVQIDGVALRPV